MNSETQLLHKIYLHGLKMNQEVCLIKDGMDAIRLEIAHIRLEQNLIRLEQRQLKDTLDRLNATLDRLDKEDETEIA